MAGNFVLLVIDGLGVGAQEDAHLYGDTGSNTLGHVSAVAKSTLPNLGSLGIGNIIPLDSVPPVTHPEAAFGKMREVSSGKDSTTGHWELAGISLEAPFPTYPKGFPEEVVEGFDRITGAGGVLANLPYSGTAVIDDFGEEHLKTGKPIVYTSADSVFQVACHEDVTSVETLYEWCRKARNQLMIGGHGVGRVIARPFSGKPGEFYRLTNSRKDFSLMPPPKNMLKVLLDNGIEVYSVGKVVDLFHPSLFTGYTKTDGNTHGLAVTRDMIKEVNNSLIFVNLIDTDQLYGHRLDVEGYSRCMEEIDQALPSILEALDPTDVLLITGDHGNDPSGTSTDHAREFVPVLVYPVERAQAVDLGTRKSFADVAATVCAFFEVWETFGAQSVLSSWSA